jgi:hypothetical protein
VRRVVGGGKVSPGLVKGASPLGARCSLPSRVA